MSNVDQLIAKLPDWKAARDALDALSALPLATKRAEVYPKVVKLAVRYWCDEEGPSDCGYELERMVAFFVRELAVEPELANAVYQAMGKRRPKFRVHPHFFALVRAARDRRAIPLLAKGWDDFYWGDATITLLATELVDDLITGLDERARYNDTDLSLAAGFLGGEHALPALLKLYRSKDGYRKDGYALGLVFAGLDDDALIKALSTQQLGATAKRIYAVLKKPKQKDRIAALDQLGKDIALSRTHVPTGALLVFCRLLADDNPELVERSARFLRDYVKERASYMENTWHLLFLQQAQRAIAGGVTATVRAALDAVQRAIPRAEPFPAGPKAKPAPEPAPSAKQTARARGHETLEKLRDALPAKPATHRNAALEAQIAEDPDDPSRYLVYADWLQTHEDARGTLISLHEAIRKNPKDKASAEAAQALLHEQRYSLLGQLDGRDDLALEWFEGFIKSARIGHPTDKQILDTLRVLLDAPSAMFLQTIVIDQLPEGVAPDAGAIVELLISRKQPATLAHLQIGKPGRWSITPELRAVFPRLQRDPAIVWAEVTAKIAEQRKLKIELDAAKLPKLEPRTGKLAIDNNAILVGLKAELDKAKPIGILAALPQVFTSESLDGFALAMAQQWRKLDQPAVKWAFDAIGPLGGDRCAEFLGENLAEWSHQRAVQGIAHLARIGSDVAIEEIITLVLRMGARARRDDARTALEQLAESRGLAGSAQLLDRVCPAHARGPLHARGVATQRVWLLDLMVSGHRITVDDFRSCVAANSLRAPLAASLVWGDFIGQHELVSLFTIGRDGSLRRADGSAYELDATNAKAHGIGLVHPAELTRAQIAEWQDTFDRRELEQAILQLARPVFELADGEGGTKLVRFVKRRVGFYALESALFTRDWYVYEQGDQGGTESFGRVYERDRVTAIATLGTTQGSIGTVVVRPLGGGGERRFDSLHPVTISELLYDLEFAHGRPEPQARAAPPPQQQAQRATPPQQAQRAQPQPIVERAKTGRSKCVVCEQAIAKDSTRVGVERLIETPSFRGLGTVWAHPACRDGMPELAGLELDLAP